MSTQLHCESCGRENPGTDDGYTTCCNELVCDGRHREKFVHDETGEYVKACCWSKAFKLWVEKYGHHAPDGSYRA
jgi:hypothetical protein